MRVSEVYRKDGRIKGQFLTRPKVLEALKERQVNLARAAMLMGDNGYRTPLIVRIVYKEGVYWNQIAHTKPWAVVWFHEGALKRKLFADIRRAVQFHKKAVKINDTATIISRQRAYDIPTKLAIAVARGRVPKRLKWCPRCCKFRRFKRRDPEERFYAMRKEWNEGKQRYEYLDRLVFLTECEGGCGTNNRDPVYRRSNQPWDYRRIKKGARRVKRHIA